MSRLPTARALFAAAVTLPLLAGCGNNDEDQGYVETVSPALAYNLEIGGGTLSIVEFVPRDRSDIACINVTPKATWSGTTQACYPRDAKAPAYTPQTDRSFIDTYKMESDGHTLLVTTFSPRLAPAVTCVHTAPRSTWDGTTMNCLP